LPDNQPASPEDDQLEAVLAEASRTLEQGMGPRPPELVPARVKRESPPEDVLYCAFHPSMQTLLRCNRCGQPICSRCAVRTAVGYRCKQCVGQQQAVFYTGGTADYVVGGAIALVLGGAAAGLMTALGAWFFALILGPTIGLGIAELVRLAVRRRRSRYLWLAVAVGMVVGAVPALLFALTGASLFRLLAPILFLALAVGAASARLR
jgi:hypothetical protein